MQQISESELVLMKIIWKNKGRALLSFIMDELEQEQNEWKQNTVLTLLSRLAKKNYLKIQKIGRRNEYIAVVTEQEYQTEQTHDFINRVYEGNVKNLVTALLENTLTDADFDELDTFWKEKTKKNE